MPVVKEGFKGQRILSFPEESITSFIVDKAVSNLYITRIGYFPEVKYHYNKKADGADYNILIYCLHGMGWFEVEGRKYDVAANQFFILPSGVPYSFGADNKEPWTIYWIHFKGEGSSSYVLSPIVPKTIPPDEDSRIQDRIDLIEEIYGSLESGFIEEYYRYACACLHHLLASFIFLLPFRRFRKDMKQTSNVIERAIHYMKEHVGEKLTLDTLADKFHMSVSRFSYLFKQYTTYSPIDYFIRLKMQRACQYLDLTTLKISEIARLLGFEDLAYFSRIFSKVMKISPSDYRLRQLDID